MLVRERHKQTKDSLEIGFLAVIQSNEGDSKLGDLYYDMSYQFDVITFIINKLFSI